MLGKIIGLYRHRQRTTTNSTDSVEWTAQTVGRGQIVKITFGTMIDYTTANKKLYLGFKDVAGTVHYLGVRKAAQYNQVHLLGVFYLIEGETPVGGVESPTSGDTISFVIHGEVYKAEG